MYQEGGDGGEAEGFVAAEVGVGEEGAEQCAEVAGAVEDVDDVGGGDGFHVEDGGEVD